MTREETPRWWVLDIRLPGRLPVYIGKIESTEARMRAALGPYIMVEGNGVTVYGKPRERARCDTCGTEHAPGNRLGELCREYRKGGAR